MKNFKFSLIVPVYNVEKYVKKCFDSLVNQTYDNYEIIAVDDGSTDNSSKIISEFKSDRIKLFHKKNGGQSSARNLGVLKSTGDYIWFVDSDDFIENNSLELLNSFLNKGDFDILSFNYIIENGDFQKRAIEIFGKTNEKDRIIINPSPCIKIFKRDYFVKNKFEFPLGRIYEDLSLMPIVMAKTNKYYSTNEYLYHYVIRDNSTVHIKEFKENRDDKFLALDYILKSFKDNKMFDIFYDEIEYLIINHLLIVYSTEVLPFSRNIYKNRCDRVLDYLNCFNQKWIMNKYFNKKGIMTKTYVYLFKLRLYRLCKIYVLFAKKIGRI